MSDTPTDNRWIPLIGGTMLNLVLGSFYAWSVFVLPLEQEFGWARSETSLTFSSGTTSTGNSGELKFGTGTAAAGKGGAHRWRGSGGPVVRIWALGCGAGQLYL